MRSLHAPLVSLFVLVSSVSAAQVDYPPFTLGGTQLRPLTSHVNGRAYQLDIMLPGSWADHPERTYPVVYVLDGYWDFPLVTSVYGKLLYDQVIPEVIIVGIDYQGSHDAAYYNTERQHEFTPTHVPAARGGMENSGGGAAFLEAFEQEIIPYVDKELRGDPSFRVLCGESLGGLFTMYSLYEKPGLFNACVAISPAVGWDNRMLFSREAALHGPDGGTAFPGTPVRLYLSTGSDEWSRFHGDIMAFDQILQHAGYKDFAYHFDVIEGARHTTSDGESYARGLQFALYPLLKVHPKPGE